MMSHGDFFAGWPLEEPEDVPVASWKGQKRRGRRPRVRGVTARDLEHAAVPAATAGRPAHRLVSYSLFDEV
jgi:hypothetical protein